MRQNDQRAIIEQLLGITILSEKAENLKEQTKQTKLAITEETTKIEAIQTANSRIEETIRSLGTKQSAWQTKKSNEIEKLEKSITELEQLDIEQELENHEKLQTWQEYNSALMALNKEKSTLESAQMRAQDSVKKVEKDILDLEDAVCYACGQELHAEKKQEIINKKAKELQDAETYLKEVSDKLNDVFKGISEIGELDQKPSTFYELQKEAYEHRNNVDSLKKSLEDKKAEEDPYQSQIDELNTEALQEIDWSPVNDLTNLKEHQDFLLNC
jgi:DNA repair exonuclease SbcCD ATPase subunit